MFCRHCGSELPSDSSFCNKCGQQTAQTHEVISEPIVSEPIETTSRNSGIVCRKCKSDNVLIAPNMNITVKNSEGCLSTILLLLILACSGIAGLVVVGIIGGLLYQVRGFLVFIVLTVWYFKIVRKLQGKPVSTALCQNCGATWGVNQNGKPYSSVSLARVSVALVLLVIFIFVGAWIINFIY